MHFDLFDLKEHTGLRHMGRASARPTLAWLGLEVKLRAQLDDARGHAAHAAADGSEGLGI